MVKRSLFPSLALTTALLTFGLIAFGAVVRVTDSGLGCGNDFPLCNGTIFPPLDNVTAWIEWLHRLFAVLIGLFGIAMLVTAFRAYRKQNALVITATLTAAGLFALQSTLGALVVVLGLPPTAVTLHLGTAMLLLGALLLGALAAMYRPREHYAADRFTILAYTTTALALVIVLTGALVRGSGATLACTDWPLCNGSLFPVSGGQSALIHMMHRYAVGGFGIVLVLLVWTVFTSRRDARLRTLAVLALVLYLAQAGIGAMYVVTSAGVVWGALHCLPSRATWALLVVLSVIETLNTRESRQTETQWQPQPMHN
ncbi:MAG: heme A synthase [Blastochloris sp.]|nr:heme A synthase [Blastochloris sp.]